MTVYLPAVIRIDEGDNRVQICATLFSIENTEKDFIITLGTSNDTGIVS